jgi:hypothetical protein
MRAMIVATILLSFASAWAQSPSQPAAVPAAAPSEQPAIVTNAAGTTTDSKPGDKATPAAADDSPIGLFIMPWRNSSAEKDIDRPARLLQGDMSPIDQVVFDRQTEYFDVLEEHAKKTGGPIKP